jgi:hypothetical protein
MAVGLAGVATGYLFSSASWPEIAYAQNDCPLSNCDFTCSNEEDEWYGDDGVWMIVHAIPTNTTTASAAVWYDDNAPDEWPRLEVTGYWKSNEQNPVTVTAKVLVDDDGTCDDLEDPYDRIRCHQPAASGTTDNYLCDSYVGIWDRVTTGSPPEGEECLEQYDLGFDFIKEFTDEGNTFYCFSQAEVKAKRPGDLDAKPDCEGSNLIWKNESSEVTFDCGEYEDQRPDGSDERLDVTVYWKYR